eukprot:43990_1
MNHLWSYAKQEKRDYMRLVAVRAVGVRAGDAVVAESDEEEDQKDPNEAEAEAAQASEAKKNRFAAIDLAQQKETEAIKEIDWCIMYQFDNEDVMVFDTEGLVDLKAESDVTEIYVADRLDNPSIDSMIAAVADAAKELRRLNSTSSSSSATPNNGAVGASGASMAPGGSSTSSTSTSSASTSSASTIASTTQIQNADLSANTRAANTRGIMTDDQETNAQGTITDIQSQTTQHQSQMPQQIIAQIQPQTIEYDCDWMRDDSIFADTSARNKHYIKLGFETFKKKFDGKDDTVTFPVFLEALKKQIRMHSFIAQDGYILLQNSVTKGAKILVDNSAIDIESSETFADKFWACLYLLEANYALKDMTQERLSDLKAVFQGGKSVIEYLGEFKKNLMNLQLEISFRNRRVPNLHRLLTENETADMFINGANADTKEYLSRRGVEKHNRSHFRFIEVQSLVRDYVKLEQVRNKYKHDKKSTDHASVNAFNTEINAFNRDGAKKSNGTWTEQERIAYRATMQCWNERERGVCMKNRCGYKHMKKTNVTKNESILRDNKGGRRRLSPKELKELRATMPCWNERGSKACAKPSCPYKHTVARDQNTASSVFAVIIDQWKDKEDKNVYAITEKDGGKAGKLIITDGKSGKELEIIEEILTSSRNTKTTHALSIWNEELVVK